MSCIPSGVPLALAAVFTGCPAVGYHRYFRCIWPAGEALWYSLQASIRLVFSQFVGLENFVALFTAVIISTPSGRRLNSARWSRLAACWSRCFSPPVDYVVRGSRFYQRMMLLPYAVAPAVAAVTWIFLFNGAGLITHFSANSAMTGTTRNTAVERCSRWYLRQSGSRLVTTFILLCRAAIHSPLRWWKRRPLFGAGPIRRFFRLSLPLIAPVGSSCWWSALRCMPFSRHLR